MKVSVIIPNYNHASYLKQRIDSVLNQTFQDFEVIILDDCSNDNSSEIIEQYRFHPKVSQVLFNEKNSGAVFKQWEKGIKLSKGEFIWIAETDDYADDTFLEALIAEINSNSNIGIVYSNSLIVNEQNKVQGNWAERRRKITNLNYWFQSYSNSGLNELKNILLFNCTINNASAALLRKSLIFPYLSKLASFKYVGDWYIYMQILIKSDICYVAKNLNFYREHQKNASLTSHSSGMQFFERFKCRSIIIKQLQLTELEKHHIMAELANEYWYFLKAAFIRREVSYTNLRNVHIKLCTHDFPFYSSVILKGLLLTGKKIFLK